MRGNHHDAWVNGASDPLSGMVAELEEARALGELAENRLAAPSAPSCFCRLGRRGARPAGLDGVGRNQCQGHSDERGGLPQHRQQRPGLPGRGGFAHAGEVLQPGRRATCTDPEKAGLSIIERRRAYDLVEGSARGAEGCPRPARPAHRGAGRGVRLFALTSSTWAFRR